MGTVVWKWCITLAEIATSVHYIYLCNNSVISQFAEARRNQQIEQLTKDRKHQHAHQMVEWKKRYLEKQNETTRRAHEDSLKHLQVMIGIQILATNPCIFVMLWLREFSCSNSLTKFVIECPCRLQTFLETNLHCYSSFG